MMMPNRRYTATYLFQNYKMMFFMNHIIKYILLFVFVVNFACIYTILAYSLVNNPWMSTFITASWAMIFILENIEQHRVINELECELEKTKQMTQITQLPKLNDLQKQVSYMKAIMSENIYTTHKRQSVHILSKCKSF
jgi:hypothetical protein